MSHQCCYGNGLVIVLSYAYTGADRIQQSLAVGTSLACTSGTGIVPLCAASAEAWRRVEGRARHGLSDLAAATIRSMVTAQVTTILAGSGKTRWCELATAASAAEPFLQVFPRAQFVCVHRSCIGVIDAGARANPWGLHGQGLDPFLLAYPGNNVAALAAYWAASTRQLVDFENAHPDNAYRVRYEDVMAGSDTALAAVRAALRLDTTQEDAAPRPQPGLQDTPDAEADGAVPVDLIPAPLRQRIARLQTELGYPLAVAP